MDFLTGLLIMVLGGIQWKNPLTAFGRISGIVLQSSIIAIAGFFIAAIFLYLYYKRLYGISEVPRGWKYLLVGLVLNGLYQLLKVPYTYEWIYGDIFVLLFLIFQLIAISILVYGLYLLRKEVTV